MLVSHRTADVHDRPEKLDGPVVVFLVSEQVSIVLKPNHNPAARNLVGSEGP